MNNPVIVYAPGVWDLLHLGHLRLLARAKEIAFERAGYGGIGILVVGVVSDDGVLAYKNRRPAESLTARIQNVARLSFVDVAVAQESTDPTPMLVRFRPDALVHGDDWDRLREGHESLEHLGVEFIMLPYTPGVSTSILRSRTA